MRRGGRRSVRGRGSVAFLHVVVAILPMVIVVVVDVIVFRKQLIGDLIDGMFLTWIRRYRDVFVLRHDSVITTEILQRLNFLVQPYVEVISEGVQVDSDFEGRVITFISKDILFWTVALTYDWITKTVELAFEPNLSHPYRSCPPSASNPVAKVDSSSIKIFRQEMNLSCCAIMSNCPRFLS